MALKKEWLRRNWLLLPHLHPTIDFDDIEIHYVKYFPPSFDNDILFVLSHVTLGVPSVYGQSVDSMDKI
jgi:hypothetical protein